MTLPLGVNEVAQWRGTYGKEFYLASLRYAQSLWMEGKPGQAILQLNRAFTTELEEGDPVLLEWPLPYAVLREILGKAREDEFLGNPVRHFQHLASRMSGPRSELRTWRAWACFHLAEAVLENRKFPRDEKQIAKEGLEIPDVSEVIEMLRELCSVREGRIVAQLGDW